MHKHKLRSFVKFISARRCNVCFILYEIKDNDFIDYILEYTMLPNPRKKIKLGIYFQSGACIAALEPHVFSLVNFL